MGWVHNLFYLMALLGAGPWLLWRRWRRGKCLGGFADKFLGRTLALVPGSGRIWLHAVSVGEVLLLGPLIAELRRRYPRSQCVLSVTTVTGREVARRKYPELTVFWFPFDFTWAVRRALAGVRPSLVLLAELELWPNFIRAAHRFGVPMVVVNGRIGERSYRGFRVLQGIMGPVLRMIDRYAVQQNEHADRLRQLGVPPERIVVTGSVKFDGVQADRDHPRVRELRELFHLGDEFHGRGPLTWVVGSTQAPEEAWAVEIYREAKLLFPGLRMILVPRHQERFNETARLLTESGLAFVRRTELPHTGLARRDDRIILVDTLGELAYVWGLADLAFVGGSFGDRGGQNMIEPAAYGAAVTFGPNVWNFQQIADALLRVEAAIQVKTKEQWRETTLRLLDDAAERERMGARGRRFVESQQGATERTMKVLDSMLDGSLHSLSVAA